MIVGRSGHNAREGEQREIMSPNQVLTRSHIKFTYIAVVDFDGTVGGCAQFQAT